MYFEMKSIQLFTDVFNLVEHSTAIVLRSQKIMFVWYV